MSFNINFALIKLSMTEAFNAQLKSLEVNVQRLVEHIKVLKNENYRLRKELNDKEESLKQMHQKLKECEEQYKLLQIAGTFAKFNQNELKLTNQKINSLVREIDECIALLTKV